MKLFVAAALGLTLFCQIVLAAPSSGDHVFDPSHISPASGGVVLPVKVNDSYSGSSNTTDKAVVPLINKSSQNSTNSTDKVFNPNHISPASGGVVPPAGFESQGSSSEKVFNPNNISPASGGVVPPAGFESQDSSTGKVFNPNNISPASGGVVPPAGFESQGSSTGKVFNPNNISPASGGVVPPSGFESQNSSEEKEFNPNNISPASGGVVPPAGFESDNKASTNSQATVVSASNISSKSEIETAKQNTNNLNSDQQITSTGKIKIPFKQFIEHYGNPLYRVSNFNWNAFRNPDNWDLVYSSTNNNEKLSADEIVLPKLFDPIALNAFPSVTNVADFSNPSNWELVYSSDSSTNSNAYPPNIPAIRGINIANIINPIAYTPYLNYPRTAVADFGNPANWNLVYSTDASDIINAESTHPNIKTPLWNTYAGYSSFGVPDFGNPDNWNLVDTIPEDATNYYPNVWFAAVPPRISPIAASDLGVADFANPANWKEVPDCEINVDSTYPESKHTVIVE